MEIKTQAALDKALKADPGGVFQLVGKIAFVVQLTGGPVSPSFEVLAGARLEISSVAGARAYVTAWENSTVTAWGNSTVTAWENSTVTARGNSTVTARGNSTVTAWENSTVTARGNSTVTARGNSTVTAWENSTVTARENSTVTAWENSTVTARGNSTVTAWENSTVTAWENSTVTARGNSTVTAWENSTVTARENSTVTAWENSTVTARGNSTVTAWENSTVTAWENSTVTAWGYAFVRAFSAKTVQASESAIVALHQRGASAGEVVGVVGGRQIVCPAPVTPQAWCDHYGVEVKDGVATLYKGVQANFRSDRGGDYTPGTVPRVATFIAEPECGPGALYFSPAPHFTRNFIDAKRYVACPVRVEDIVVHPDGSYPEKVKAIGACAPVWEVDINGNAIVQPQPEAA